VFYHTFDCVAISFIVLNLVKQRSNVNNDEQKTITKYEKNMKSY